jgi:hypothetical protein
MSVYNASGLDSCWLCGEAFPPGGILVLWYAAGGQLVLHPGCAQQLGSVLIFEAGRAGMIERGQNPMTGLVCRVGHDDPKITQLRRGRDE